MRSGRRIAIDVGTVRLGIAVCDQEGILASPLEALRRSSETAQTVSALVELVKLHQAVEVYVGEPLSLSGKESDSTNDARSIALDLASALTVPVRMIDERFTTVSAATKLRAAGISSRDSKSLIDSASAVEILESALSQEKSSGLAPGQLVGDSVGA
jgi:putative Holliday junction resolvase